MKFINIGIETHNIEDPYYKYYINKTFYTKRNLNYTQIQNILKSITPVQYEDKKLFSCGELEIDTNDLFAKLAEHEIYPVSIDIEHYYDIDEEDGY